MKNRNIARFSFVLLVFALVYIAVLIRLFYWQIIRYDDLKSIGLLQSSESLFEQPNRGEILSNDNFPLATNKTTYLVYANPKVIKDKEKYAQILSDITQVSQASISAQLKKNLFWVKIASSLSESDKANIEKNKLEGIGFQAESVRYYPEASMAAHLVGFLGKDEEGKDKGYFGIEGYYDEQLRGRPGKLYVVKDALGNQIIGDVREEKKINGRSLVLNLDRAIQYVAEKKLKEGIGKYEAEGGSVILMEPKSGKIIAMASFPSFNPQTYWKFSGDYYKNPVISSLYEPGSTFKTVIMSTALDLGAVKPETRCDICSGPVKILDYNIKTWNDKYFPNETMTEVIQRSDNTGMVFVGQKVGLSNLLKFIKLFGMGSQTKIDLQGEVSGSLRKEPWYPIDLATATFGQGISITPIQLISAVSAIANGGNLMTPHVVSKIITEDGKIIEIKPEVKRRVISEKAARMMTWMMVNAVENGEAKWTKINDYKIAGKTGTAQIPVQGHYDKDKTIASFVGFLPADDPKVAMLVLIDRPKAKIYGSETAAPIFFSIARELINYYNILPTY